MNDETNNNGNDSKDDVQTILDEIEKRLYANDLTQDEFRAMMLRLEFQSAKHRAESDKRLTRIEENLNYVTQLIKFFGDKSFEFYDKLTKAGEILAEKSKR